MKTSGWRVLLWLLPWFMAGAGLGYALAATDACRTRDVAPITYVVHRHD